MKSIVIDHISKAYSVTGSKPALNDVSMDVGRGEVFGLIGPDGAGKTTLFRILTTLIMADRGSAAVEGLDVVKDYKKIRKMVGYMPGRFSLYQDLSVRENLQFFATIFNTTIEENYDLIKNIYDQLLPFEHRMAGDLSGGMKQKLALSCALIHRPVVLFLDEPTTGVDVVSRKEFWEMLHILRGEGISILVSTPYMDEASLCDRIGLIQEGQLFSIDTPGGMIEKYPHSLYAVKSDHMYRLLLDLKSFPSTMRIYSFGEYHHIIFKEEGDVTGRTIDYLSSRGHEHIELMPVDPTVEDCFLDFMEHEKIIREDH